MTAAEDDRAKARKAALALLARREQSRAELRLKLARKSYPEALVDDLLDELAAAGWLSEQRYCESLLRQRMQQGYGPLRLAWEYGQQGIDRSLSAEVLESVEAADWLAVAQGALDKRYGAGADYARQANFLKRRGFSAAQIGQVMKARRQGGGSEDI